MRKQAEPQVVDGWLVFEPAFLRRVANKKLRLFVGRARVMPGRYIVIADAAWNIKCPAVDKRST